VKNPMTMWVTALVTFNAFAAPGQTPTNDAQIRALELLRKTVAEREGRPTAVATGAVPTAPTVVAPSPAPARLDPIPADLEQQYLTGKITAKQFQKALEESRRNPKPPVSSPTNDPRVLESLRQSSAPPAAAQRRPIEPVRGASALAPRIVPGNEPKPAEAPAISPAAQSQFSEVEKKMDELMRLKASRDNASTNAAPESAAPKTKRERLDDLLRQLINGKITDVEYKEKREKVIAGPD